MQLCPRCGEENPDRFRLCGYCGAELAPPPPAREERRTVTIVFSDLKGSTNLGEALDPESLREVMSRYFEDQTRALRRHGGTVEKFIGDAIMAVFGLPRLHEDDALRAVRAANEMQRSLAALNQELELRWGVTLTNRTGVNTGEVVAGDAATGQRLATGDAVNVAARLEQAAPPNEILLGDLTYQLVRDAVEVETVEPLELKGKAERVPAYRLISVRGEEGVLRRQDAAFVGRETERAILIDLFERARDQRRCLIGTVVGEAGVGKSRLVAETLGSIGARGRTLRGRCLPYGEGITFWPILDIVREAAGIQPEDPVGTAMDRLRETSGDPRVAERVGAAIGFSSEPFPVSELFWGIRQFLDRVAADQPLVLVIDDIHWAESTLLDLLEHLNASLAAPVLVLATARHDLLEQRPTWGDSADAARLELYRLSEAEAGQVIEHLLGDAGIADQVKRRIVTAAEGNPLFVEQLVSMLVGGGQLRMEEGRWVAAAGDAADLAIPPTIQALLGSRLGQLAPNERSVIEPASVIGLEFRQAAVTELSPAPLQGDVPRLLGAMTRKHLLRENPPELSENEFRFEHILIRDAAYNALLKRTRATLHEQFVEWADRTNSEREAVEYDEILAYHLEQSYRYLAELGPLDDHGTELGRRASRRLAAAGRRAFGRGDMPAAASLLRRAGETLPPGDPDRIALLPELGETLMELGDLGAADTVLTEALTAAAAAGDAVLHARAKIIMQLVTLHAGGEGWADEAIRDAEGALDTFQAARDAAGLALANRLLWAIHGTANRNGLATQAAEQVIEHARAAGDRRLEARGASGYAVTALYGPTPVAEAIERGEALVRQIEGDRRTEAFILGALAQLRGMRGEVAEARELARRSAAMLEELGVGILSSATSIDSARIELLAGDLDAAALDLRRDYDALTLMGERFLLSTVGGMLARVEYLRDQFTEAESLARVVRELSAPDDIDAQALWRSVLAMVLARAAAIDEAIALAQEAVTLRRQADAPVLLAEALEDFGEVLRFAGRDEEARSQRQQALALYEQKGDEVSAGRLRTLLS